MTVIDVAKDVEAKTLTLSGRFDAPIARVWEVWNDPRQLERWWGPPTYPATVVDHDLSVGGRVSYYMTGPEGDQPRGWWEIRAVDPPRYLEFEDGFADDEGNPNPDMPTMVMRVTLSEEGDGGTLMEVVTTFPSAEAMEELISMGMDEGIKAAAGQIDEVLGL